jgi:hypothetical protein
MPATSVTITAGGLLTDVDLGDPDLRPAHLRRLIGCAAVHAVGLSAELPLNIAATDLVMLAPVVPNQTDYGTVVLTGGTVDGSDINVDPQSGRTTWRAITLSDWSTRSARLVMTAASSSSRGEEGRIDLPRHGLAVQTFEREWVMDEIRFGGEWHRLGDQSAATVRRAMMAAVKAGETVTVSLTAEDGTITVLFWTPGVPVTFRTRTPLRPSG